MRYKSKIRILVLCFVSIFILINIVAYFHAYKFTHFDNTIEKKTDKPKDLRFWPKVKTLIFGIDLPKPKNNQLPSFHYRTINLQSNSFIECWEIEVEKPRGTVVIFHGFSGHKSSMLDKAEVFHNLGYNTFLVDFMGSGGSEGLNTTIGYKEALDVKTCVNYITDKSDDDIILFGTSMGSVAIMKAINDYDLTVSSIIIECPFGTMLETVQSRFNEMNVPSFPMAHLLVFWGGFQNGFNAFDHNPIEYSKSITCPTLLLYGEKDNKVSRSEIDLIFENMNCEKSLKLYPESGHENYLYKYPKKWKEDVSEFLLNKNE